MLSQVIIVIISFSRHFILSANVFLIILWVLTLVFLIPTLMSQKLQEKQSALQQSEHLTASVTDILNGFATVKATQTLPYFLKDFQKINQIHTQAKISSGQWIMSNYATFGHAGDVCAVCRQKAAIWFIMQGTMSIGVMLTMVQTMNTLVYPLIDIFRLISIKSTRLILQNCNSRCP